MTAIAITTGVWVCAIGVAYYALVVAQRELAKAKREREAAATDRASAERLREQAARDFLEARNVHANCQRPQVIEITMPPATMPVVGKRGVA